ncbi:ATP-binding protein [Paenibacillus sp. YPG26]|uniref:ATP-binding protein n=1 Tax=Paenibacillus sp. YPG26 TaxID=2878915 RepID=UPI00203BEDC7|nr:ATP-binding protein [Paenibacillus sp. YPG26]USB32702.1 histidine kinase [Paenibacillus sp. YPG26]
MSRGHRAGYAVFAIVFMLAAYFVYIGVRYPAISLVLTPTSSGEWIIKEGPQEDAWAYGRLQQGDAIISLDGRPVQKHPFVVKTHRISSLINHMTIERDGERIEIPIPAFDSSHTLFKHVLYPGLIFILLFVLSLRAYQTQGRQRDTKLLISYALLVGLSYLCSAASSRYDPFGVVCIYVLFCSVPVLLLHFLYEFFSTRQARPYVPRILLTIMYGDMASWTVGVLLYVYTNLFASMSHNFEIITVLSFFVLLQLTVILFMIRNLVKSSASERTFHIYILTAQMIAYMPFLLLHALPRIVFGTSILEDNVAGYSVIAVPVIFFYLLKVKEIIDIQFVLHRLRHYGLLALWPSIALVAVMILIWQGNGNDTVKWLETFLLIYSSLVAFLYYKDYLHLRIRRYMSKKPAEATPAEQLLDRSTRIKNAADLELAMMQEIEAKLRVSSIALLESSAEGIQVKRQQGTGPESHQLESIAAMAANAQAGSFIPVDAGTCLLYGEAQGRQQLLWFGSKYNRTQLNPDEVAWLQAMLNYASILYINLRLTQDFAGQLEESITSPGRTPTWLLRLLFTISENERKRLSSDLHDSALQDQLLLYRKLESLLSSWDQDRPRREELEEIRDGMLDVVAQIRETCNELRPPFLKEMGLVEAIEQMLSQIRLRTNLAIEFQTDGFHAGLEEQQELTLYRIVQELMQNAVKHAQDATHVDLYFRSTNSSIKLVYRDNGIGMDTSKLTSSYSHMGLWGIQERVASLEGTFRLRSKPGQGLHIDIKIPLAYEERRVSVG